ncbi:FAD-dependent oxidoreductase [Parapedobacter tibetensis]|uniref:FAD-dependent oxidoreductase n=1 Tax=Parapedobacter tibetensis TaxID=2972951 RepID=UPI00214DC763|nr:FAD-dependent oxidoreductase [Parapedobacter tibetensis]
MDKIYIRFCLLALLPLVGFSQSKRPQVLVYGSGVDAYAAAMQSSMSNLNTVWVVDSDKITPELTSEAISIESNVNLDAGIWADFLAKVLRHDQRSDSISAIAKRKITPQIAQNVIDDAVREAKNLTIIKGAQALTVKKSGKNWQIQLTNRQRFKVRAVVDASADAVLHQLAYGKTDSISTRTLLSADYFQSEVYDQLSRTGVAVGDLGGKPFTLPLAALVPADDSNLFLTRKTPVVQPFLDGTAETIPLLMHVGQAIGAAAAYTAFFKTTSDKLDARNVQGELLQYGARLMPFGDVPIESPHFASIQRIGATGVLQTTTSMPGGHARFDPDSPVVAWEIQPVLNQLFSRSQIWFVDHAEVDTLTLANLFSYIKFVGQRGDELEGQVQKYWNKRFHFTDEYDEQMIVTRRHVAVLLDTYCKPFEVKVGLDGTIQR